MRILKFGLAAAVAFLSCFSLKAQTGDYDVFVPIAKYLSQGNTEAISAGTPTIWT